MNFSLRHSVFLLLYAFLAVLFIFYLTINNFFLNITESNTKLLIHLVYFTSSLFLLITACIMIILHIQVINTHHFFFIASFLSVVPLLPLRATLLFPQYFANHTENVIDFFIQIASWLYITMSLCLFLSVLFFNKKYALNICIFLVASITSLLGGTLGPIGHISSDITIYVGGKNFFFYTSIAFYAVIIILYFFELMYSKTEKKIAVSYFLTLAGLIISLLTLCLATQPTLIIASGILLAMCLAFYIRNQFIRRL